MSSISPGGWTKTSRSTAVEHANMNGLHHSLSYMPDGVYKRFNQWLLKDPQLAESWAQLLGLRGTARMTDEVLEGLLNSEQLEQMVPLCVPMTMMLTYEVASDNIAIGLANALPSDTTLAERAELLTCFSEVMIQKLQGDQTPTISLMESLQPLTQRISAFSQSLSERKYHQLLTQYLTVEPDTNRDDIEYSLYEILIANIDCGVDVVKALDSNPLQPFVRDWLVRRYQGQATLVNQRNMSQDELIRASIDAIMVVPTMAYYVAQFVEQVAPNPHYTQLLDNGVLLDALEKTALLVRLLNDLGTDVIEQNDEAHALWVNELRQEQQRQGYATFIELMMNYIPQRGVSFTRLKKDVMFGEYNVALHFSRQEADVDQAITILYNQLCFISGLYRESLADLYRLAEIIEHTLGTPMVSSLLTRFVEYHQMFYRNSFEEPSGEYGI